MRTAAAINGVVNTELRATLGCPLPTFVAQVVEQVVGCHGRFTTLLEPKDKVDPRVQLPRSFPPLQRLTHGGQEARRVAMRPARQDDVIHRPPVLPYPQR